MSNDQHDESLFADFESLVPTVAASQRAVNRTREALLRCPDSSQKDTEETAHAGIEVTHPRLQAASPSITTKHVPWPRSLAFRGLATFVLLTVCVGVWCITTQRRVDSVALTDASYSKGDQQVSEFRPELPVVGIEMETEIPSKTLDRLVQSAILDLAEFAAPIIHPQVAEYAPVIVANGGTDPIALGSTTYKGGGLLHVWDWSKGNRSRILPGIEFWGNEKVILSPDGKYLVWASGKILELASAKGSNIDLGGADVKVGDATYHRIGDMRFSPDGSRLVLLVTNIDKDIPGRIENQMVQVVDFPTGRPLCAFPPGEQYALRIGLSSDGKQIASADPERRISRRDSTTGKILETYLPALKAQVMGVAISADGKFVAASQREPGDVYVWEANTGRLLHRIDGEDLRKLGGHDPAYGAMRFSPDGKHLAAAYWGRLFVFEVETGKIVAALREDSGASIQWSADGEKLTVVIPAVIGESGVGGRENTYPAVHEWDWQNTKQIVF